MSGHSTMACKVFDCVIYDGEIDALVIRLHELEGVVDCFVIVESTLTFSGLPRALNFNPGHPGLSPFADRFRHVVVADMPATDGPWQRECWQRNAVLRGVPDAAPDDLLILSDVDEIPRAAVVSKMRDESGTAVFGLELAFFTFLVDYRNVEGPEAAIVRAIAARRSALGDMSPSDMRHAVRERRLPARIIGDAGWHFSHLMDEARLRREIAAFSHRELNNAAFLETIDIAALVERRGDFFQRPGFAWALVDRSDLPVWLQANKDQLAHLFAPGGPRPAPPVVQMLPPVVICPYLLDHERDEIVAKFALDSEQGAAIPFFLWQDVERIGPERAFAQCWDRFPDRDIIIIHSDMAPFPGDPPTAWYDKLCEYRSLRPDAGMIAANLFYPSAGPDAVQCVQCAGGTFLDETIGHLHGDVDRVGGVSQSLLDAVRPVDWVTFGGVLIRREVIKACGNFDGRYRWAYYMDCDYCFEARRHGFRLLQAPVRLLHEESRSTRSMMVENSGLARHIDQNKEHFSSKWRDFLPMLPNETQISMADSRTKNNVDKIMSLDTDIFSIQRGHYPDREAFLRIQGLMREIRPGYSYLEAGSDIGGWLLPHLLDPCCAAAVSVVPRPPEQPDERGADSPCIGNSIERMREDLSRHLRPHELGKLSTIEQDLSAIDQGRLALRPHLVLIDGAHTNVAAFSDFMAILPLIAGDALVTFHDADLVGDAIQMIERFLRHARTPHSLAILPGCVAVFSFGAFIHAAETVLGPHAEPTAACLAGARHQRHRPVADAVIGQSPGLPGRTIAELLAANNTAQIDIARLRSALDQAEAAQARDQALISSLQASIDALKSSTSWRVTAPLRVAVGLVRGRGA